MFPTVEVRWFYPGRVPAAVLAWFQGGAGQRVAPARRVDYYLCLPGADWLGAKLREGRLELKQRQGPGQDFRPHDRVSGRVEQWRKWSFALAEGPELVLDAAWVAVEKARRLRRYRLAPDRQIVAVPVETYPAQGFNWELTEVGAGGQVWWSVGFEAFGDEAGLRDGLFPVVEHALQAEGLPTLEVQDSYGYPHWLALLSPATINRPQSGR
jgi:hypothetical protein